MTVTKFDPLALVGTNLFNDLNRLFERPGATAGEWAPRVDVADAGEAVMIRAELPGIEPDSIDITIEQDLLVISGSRSFENKTEEATEAGVTYRRREIVEGNFVRKIRLSAEVDVDAVTATSTNGILEITVPKQPEELPRKVTVAVQR